MHTSFYVLIGGFLSGVAVRSLHDVGVASILFVVLLSVVVGVLTYPYSSNVGLYVTLALLAFVLGAIRTEFAYQHYARDQSSMQPGEVSVLQGYIAREPDARDEYTVLVVQLTGVDESTSTSVLVRVKVPRYPAFAYGDTVVLSGELAEPRSFETDSGRMFNYPGYLMKEGVHFELRRPVVTRTQGNAGNPIYATLLSIKNAWLESVSRLIPEPESALAGGLVVGAKQSLGEKWLDLFRVTGIIHIVVLSGYNLSLIANGIMRLLSRAPRRIGVVLGSVGVIAFAFLAGLSATVVRATIMALLALLAEHLHRPHTVTRLLALAASAMVLVNPFVLVFDVGFQLSFIATLGLILYVPLFEKWFAFVPRWGELRGIVAATFATQLAVLPLLIYETGQVSTIAPLVNVLVLPVVAPIMALVFIAGVVGLVSPLLALTAAWPAFLLLSYVFSVVANAGKFHFAAVTVAAVPAWLVVAQYSALMGITWWYANAARTRAATSIV